MQKEFLLLESELVNCIENYLPQFKFRVPSISNDELNLLVQQCSERMFTSSIKRSGNGVTIICEQINQVTILKSDFDNVEYTDNEDCALARALKRKFPKLEISVGGITFNIGENINLEMNLDTAILIKDMCKNKIDPTNLVVVYK